MITMPQQSILVKVWNTFEHVVPGEALSPELNRESLINSAIKIAGHRDFGSTSFLDPLGNFLESLNETGRLHPFGKFFTKKLVIGLLVNRLKLHELWRQYPEILSESLPKPFIILGLPRSGTSFLFNLLSQDPEHRVLSNWEATISQVPPTGSYSFENDPRRKQAIYFMRFQNYLAPQMKDMHEFFLDGPEECTPLLMQEFTTEALALMFNVPAYADWLKIASHTETYHHHRRILQSLQWKYPRGRWLLKSPSHTAIEDIMRVYPDACVVQMHRDPVKSISSCASLSAAFRSIHSESIDVEELGMQSLNILADNFDLYLDQRQRCDTSQFIDFQYSELVREPLVIVKRLYQYFDVPLTAKAEKCMQDFLARDRTKKRAHRYSPENYGLSADLIRTRFNDYIQTFNIPEER